MDSLANVIERAGKVQNGEAIEPRTNKFNTYAVSNFRGGIGLSLIHI